MPTIPCRQDGADAGNTSLQSELVWICKTRDLLLCPQSDDEVLLQDISDGALPPSQLFQDDYDMEVAGSSDA